jgi:hypothetical protein
VPLVALFVILALIVFALIALLPISLAQRYRMGTARRLARGWVATLNLLGFAISVVMFLATAAVTSTWVPRAFIYTLTGLAAGCLLGLVGLALSRWEATPRSLYYTPNRWLVLALTLAVTSRVLYGFWRGWQAWRSSPEDPSWVAASGMAGSMAAGAVVLGYYLVYWAGVRRRLKRHKAVKF